MQGKIAQSNDGMEKGDGVRGIPAPVKIEIDMSNLLHDLTQRDSVDCVLPHVCLGAVFMILSMDTLRRCYSSRCW